MMSRVYEDFQFALRLIRGNRTLSVAIFVSLAFGIGASASMFGAVDAFLLRPIPVPQTERIIRITAVTKSTSVGDLSYPNFDDLRKRATVFESIAATRNPGAAVDTHNGGQSRVTLGLAATGDFFRMLQIAPVLGRAFGPEEDQIPSRDAVVMLSYAMWQRDFAGKPDVIGKNITLNRKDFTIIGVVPQTFRGVNSMVQSDFYIPRMMLPAITDAKSQILTDRRLSAVEVYARLKPGVSLEQARAEVTRIAAQLEQEYPAENTAHSFGVFTQVGYATTDDPESFVASMLFLFIGALVLGIACVNVGNLLLSTAPARTRETAVRLAMGATRSRLIGQFMVESCVLSLCASAAGIGIAAVVSRFARSIQISSGLLPVSLDMRADTRVTLFAFAVGIGAGVVSGLIPAFRCSRGDLNQLMRSADPRTPRSRMPFRQILVAAQVALTTLVLVVAGGALQSLSILRKADPGFRVDNVLTIAMDPKLSRGLSITESVRFYEQLVERVRGISGVQAAGVGHLVPLGVLNSPRNVRIDGYSMPPGETSLRIETNSVGEGYFNTLGIPILRGRAFDLHDTTAAPRVVIINEAMAQKYWPGRDPLGMRIQIDNPDAVSAQIVGIAKTGKYRGIEESPLPFLYVPMTQSEDQFMWLFVATKDEATRYVSLVRDAVRDVDPQQPIYDVQTLADTVRRQALWADILGAQIATGAAVVGLLLGVLGLYAMLSYSVSQRTREIGIRMAVGATAGRVSRMIVAQGMKLSLAGMAAGLVCAIALDSAVPEMSTTGGNKPAVYVIVVAVVIAVALLSSYYPARRAARIDPNECLRSE